MKTRLLLLILLSALSPMLRGSDHGVILLYHHVSDETPPSTSVSPDRFIEHLDYLTEHDFKVVPLQTLLEGALGGGALPENAIAITFDDAYESVYTEAAARLAERNLPFTVFVASQPLDEGIQGYMSWSQLSELPQMGGAIGGHSHSHDHLARRQRDESEQQWLQRAKREVDYNLERLEAELGLVVEMFAYPYGEYSPEIKKLLEDRQLYGLAQQSGASGRHTDPQQIPRFPMSTGQDSLERLRLAAKSRPLPVVNEQAIGSSRLRIELASDDLPAVSCYSADGVTVPVAQQDLRSYQIELPPTQAGRNKVNCTAPTREKEGEFYWYSYLWLGD